MDKSSKFYHLNLAFFISLFAFPVTFFFDNGFKKLNDSSSTLTFIMMLVGCVIFILVPLAAVKLSRPGLGWVYYVMILFSFTCVIDLIITLEFNGFIQGFMSVYLNFGEPYLKSSYGSAIAFFDGIGLYLMYLAIIYQISNGMSWRSTGIYWASAILNSMFVLLFGVLTGRHSSTFCTFLNVPYVMMPLIILGKAVVTEKRGGWRIYVKRYQSNPLTFYLKGFLVIGLLISIWILFAKGSRALGSDSSLIVATLQSEPAILKDWAEPAKFASLQSLIYLFYCIPILIVQMLYIFSDEKPHFLWEISLISNGALLQGQFSMIGQALDPQTPPEFKSDWRNLEFWFLNLIIVIIPHIYMFTLWPHRVNDKGAVKTQKKRK